VLQFNPQAETCRWIFAYGSLMWRPGFDFERKTPARLAGYHRRLSVYSHHYRGSVERPGLVFGLDRGGSCHGMAYQVPDDSWADVLEYVRKREMITGVYREVIKNIFIPDRPSPVLAVTYAVNRTHSQCAPQMSVPETMSYVNQGHGLAGSCADYVFNTLHYLRAMGIHDATLENLALHLNDHAALAQEERASQKP
jgi:glutathione-specific gamma-glutamylcyclotransferase